MTNVLMNKFKEITEIVNNESDPETHLNVTKKLDRPDWSKAIIKAAVEYLKGADSAAVEAVEKHYDKTMYMVIKTYVRPFSVLKLAAEQVTPKEFMDTLLRHSKDDKIIIDFCKEEEFVEKVKAAHKFFWEYEWTAEPKLEMSMSTLKPFDDKTKMIVDHVLSSNGWPSSDNILKDYQKLGLSFDMIEKLKAALAGKDSDIEDLRSKLASAAMVVHTPIEIAGTTEIPTGRTVRKLFTSVFPGISVPKDFEITCWEWDGPHPMVPRADPDYIFRDELLLRVVYAIETNQRGYLQGHTGTGKTTLIEQVASRMGYPTMRINFDSEITRMDLIGRDTLKDGESKFIDGMLPSMMSQPCIGIFDEIDFCRPDVAYVMQSALENNSLRITEDGGREVKPHPMFRMFGTGNTVGQGDELGMYQGARPQSLAFLDRFTVWIKVDYLSETERAELIKRHYPALGDKEQKTLGKYVTEHIAAFTEGKVLQPISPRGMLATAKTVLFYQSIGMKEPVKLALAQTVLDRANNGDHITLKGIVDRVCK